MPSQPDPYRTLGVAPGASLNEIKSAYRRLAKQYHPDRAGERALPRFLSIQAAYEALVDGEGRLRPPGAGSAGPRRSSAPRPSESWRADPNRARASRDAWRARRAGAAGGGATGAGGSAGSGTRTRAGSSGGAGTGTSAGSGGPGDASRERPRREHHARRGPRKATPGSTTYDEAGEVPFEPEWDGGAWYGPSSGTFWTINPREYADPRKHGPEYLARARRAMGGGRDADPAGAAAMGPDGPDATLGFDDPVAPGPRPDTDAGDARWRFETASGRPGGGASRTGAGAEWGTRSWRYDDVPPPGDRPFDYGHRRSRSGPAVRPEDVQFPDLEAYARRFAPRNLLALARRPDPRWRLALALTGWPPIGYALATLLSEATGCAALAPSCPEPVSALTLLLQPLVVAALFLAAPAAAVAAFAGIAAVAVALPVAAVLSVGTGPGSRVGAPVLGVAVAAAYFVAFLWGAREAWRADDGAGRDA